MSFKLTAGNIYRQDLVFKYEFSICYKPVLMQVQNKFWLLNFSLSYIKMTLNQNRERGKWFFFFSSFVKSQSNPSWLVHSSFNFLWRTSLSKNTTSFIQRKLRRGIMVWSKALDFYLYFPQLRSSFPFSCFLFFWWLGFMYEHVCVFLVWIIIVIIVIFLHV